MKGVLAAFVLFLSIALGEEICTVNVNEDRLNSFRKQFIIADDNANGVLDLEEASIVNIESEYEIFKLVDYTPLTQEKFVNLTVDLFDTVLDDFNVTERSKILEAQRLDDLLKYKTEQLQAKYALMRERENASDSWRIEIDQEFFESETQLQNQQNIDSLFDAENAAIRVFISTCLESPASPLCEVIRANHPNIVEQIRRVVGICAGCGERDLCCPDPTLGSVCYSPTTHRCTQPNRVLCGINDEACGTICYDPLNYKCVNNALQVKPVEEPVNRYDTTNIEYCGRIDDEDDNIICTNNTTHMNKRANVRTNRLSFWDRGVVPYTIHRDLQVSQRIELFFAMKEWESKTCVKFDSVSIVDESDSLGVNLVIFKPHHKSCNSVVGKLPIGPQTVNISPWCHKGKIMHELGHLLGLHHEQQRIDRDQYVRIHFDCILKSWHDQYTKNSDRSTVDLLPYNYESIMHYPHWAPETGATPGCPMAMEPIPYSDTIRDLMGQRNWLTYTDTESVNILQGCKKCTKHSDCHPMGYCGLAGSCQVYQALGHLCLRDIECKSGTCLYGRCQECDSDSDCAHTQFCNNLLSSPLFIRECRARRSNGAVCLRDRECASGMCSAGRCQTCLTEAHCPGGFCHIDLVTTNECRSKKPTGSTCLHDGQCLSSRCQLGFCHDCDKDYQCGTWKYCHGIFNPFDVNHCMPKLANGQLCSRDAECQSNMCQLHKCVECVVDAHCPSDKYCKGRNNPFNANFCEPRKNSGWCSRDRECVSGKKCKKLRCK